MMVDVHSHILPGIDDGARTFDDSIEIVRALVDQGVTDIIATPHYVSDTIYMSTRTANTKLLNELKGLLKHDGINVNLYLGNELYIDSSIKSLLNKRTVSTLAGSKYIMVELPLNGEFPNYIDILGDLLESGYKVVLAHPERYAIAQEDFEVLQELYEMGVLLQCNYGSFLGKYDKYSEKTAIHLAKEKMIFALGSDIHSTRRRDTITKSLKKLRKYYSDAELKKILVDNPRKIIESGQASLVAARKKTPRK